MSEFGPDAVRLVVAVLILLITGIVLLRAAVFAIALWIGTVFVMWAEGKGALAFLTGVVGAVGVLAVGVGLWSLFQVVVRWVAS